MATAEHGDRDLNAATVPLGAAARVNGSSSVRAKTNRLTMVRRFAYEAKPSIDRGRAAARRFSLWLSGASIASLLAACGFLFESWEVTLAIAVVIGFLGWEGVCLLLLVAAAVRLGIRYWRRPEPESEHEHY